jgi:hypothetical protein
VDAGDGRGKAEFHLGQRLLDAGEDHGQIRLDLAGADGARSTLRADHLIAATGYRPDIHCLGFLSPELRARVHTAADTPVLSRNFESSISGLYFVGPASANSFGPVARFAFGAGFTARRLARHFSVQLRHRAVRGVPGTPHGKVSLVGAD